MKSASYAVIPVSRAAHGRKRPPVTAGLNKQGDLVLVFSPAFLESQAFGIGSKVQAGYACDPKRVLLIPPAPQASHLRLIRGRYGWPGAGMLVISAPNLPEDEVFHTFAHRRAVAWEAEEGGVIALRLE